MGLTTMDRVPRTFRTMWFLYCVVAVLGWAAWALLLKIGSVQIPSGPSIFLQTAGMVPLALILLLTGSVRGAHDKKGIAYSLLNGIITGGGILCLLAAYRRGGNTSVVAVTTSLYPLVTFALAVIFLREKLTRVQVLGVVLATVSIILFSF
jgi:uncharacterized membrane protein